MFISATTVYNCGFFPASADIGGPTQRLCRKCPALSVICRFVTSKGWIFTYFKLSVTWPVTIAIISCWVSTLRNDSPSTRHPSPYVSLVANVTNAYLWQYLWPSLVKQPGFGAPVCGSQEPLRRLVICSGGPPSGYLWCLEISAQHGFLVGGRWAALSSYFFFIPHSSSNFCIVHTALAAKI